MKEIKLLLVGLIGVLVFTQLAVASSSYDPEADVNKDGAVDVNDLYRVGQAYGSTGNAIQYLSIPMSAFTPRINTSTYLRNDSGGYLYGFDVFLAPFQLPHGATVTNITFHLIDSVTNGEVLVWVRCWNLSDKLGLPFTMTELYTGWAAAPGEVVLFDETIEYAVIDNINCYYMIGLYFSYQTLNLALRCVLVEYTP